MGLKDKKKTKKRTLELAVEKDKKLGSLGMKKRKREKGNDGGSAKAVQVSVVEDDSAREINHKKEKKKLRKEKRKKVLDGKCAIPKADDIDEVNYDEVEDQSQFGIQGESESADMVLSEDDVKSKKARKKKKKDSKTLKESKKALKKGVRTAHGEPSHSSVDGDCSKEITRIAKKARKNKIMDMESSNFEKSVEREEKTNLDDVYLIPSDDEGCPKGIKKWIMQYQQSRPGLEVLQQRIDDFIIAHEAKREQERKEKEALSAEGGWQVVQHHKGRKKTRDAESGIVVGSVAQAAVENKRAKKKNTDIGLDFYRFQRKEAQRNEIMMLQSKFELDKKRIQQLRAARKFKPY